MFRTSNFALLWKFFAFSFVETLQRIDRHSEEIKLLNKQFDLHGELIERQQEEIQQQQEAIAVILTQIQKHQKRFDIHGEGPGAFRERTEAIHQSSLEQMKAYQSMTELLMHHNQALTAKGIL